MCSSSALKGFSKIVNRRHKVISIGKMGSELDALLGPGSWSPNRGAISPKAETLQPGHRIDRFGGWHDSSGDFRDMGSFVSPEGEKFYKRALPMATRNKSYMSYEVLQPLDVESAEAIPWFGMQGKGTQYELSDSIEKLVADGYLKPVTPKYDLSKL